MTCFVTAVGLSVHGETPFAVECGAGLPVGRKIGTVAPLNSQSLPVIDELDHYVVGDHTHGKAVNLRTSWPSVLAGAVRAFAASVAIIAVTNPAPPVQSELVAGRNEAAAS